VKYVSREKPHFEATKVLHWPFLDVLMPCVDFNAVISKLRYDIIVHNFHPAFIFCMYMLKTFKTELYLCIKQRFLMHAEHLRCMCACVCVAS